MPSASDTITWYDANAATVVARYEAHDPAALNGWFENLLPNAPAVVMDIGAGSGRDAAWLAARGYEVLAVEPSTAMRTEATGKLIWLNLLFMLTIVTMPYTTAMYSEFSNAEQLHLSGPYAFYAGNIVAAGLLNYLLWRYTGNPRNGLAEQFPDGYVFAGKWRALVMPAVFALSWVISLWWPVLGRITLFLIAPLMMFLPSQGKGTTTK